MNDKTKDDKAEIAALKAQATVDKQTIDLLREDKKSLKAKVDELQDKLDKWQARAEKAKAELRLKRRDVAMNHLPGKGR
jgi:phage shock protein A